MRVRDYAGVSHMLHSPMPEPCMSFAECQPILQVV